MAIQTEGSRLALRASGRPQLDLWLVGFTKGPFCWWDRNSGCERERCSDVRRTEQRRKLCSMWMSPHN